MCKGGVGGKVLRLCKWGSCLSSVAVEMDYLLNVALAVNVRLVLRLYGFGLWPSQPLIIVERNNLLCPFRRGPSANTGCTGLEMCRKGVRRGISIVVVQSFQRLVAVEMDYLLTIAVPFPSLHLPQSCISSLIC